MLGYFIISQRIEAEPSKIKSILAMTPPTNEKEIRGLLGKMQYINRFISKLTMVCELVISKLRKNEPKEWDEDFQKALDTIKGYISNLP